MDMKAILQAFDNVVTPAVTTMLSEGANPHKVSLPVQMTMNHYQTYTAPVVAAPSILRAYIQETEDSFAVQKAINDRQLSMYSRKIANRVLMKESSARYNVYEDPEELTAPVEPVVENQPDVVKLDIPLLIRLLEYAREDAKTDMDLHNLAEMLIHLSEEGVVLTMDQYDQIVGDRQLLEPPQDMQ